MFERSRRTDAVQVVVGQLLRVGVAETLVRHVVDALDPVLAPVLAPAVEPIRTLVNVCEKSQASNIE